jgi:hypothetical protein
LDDQDAPADPPSATGSLSRRTVLVGGALIGVAGLAGVALATGALPPDDDAPDDTTPTTRPPVAPAEGIATVGAAYLATADAGEADVAALRQALPTLTGGTPEELIAQLGTIRPAVEADFTEDRVVEVDGWILAHSEARAAALVHLVA